MSDRALLAKGGANTASIQGPTMILNGGGGTDVASRHIAVIDPSTGFRYAASRAATYEHCIFDGLSGRDDCDISETKSAQANLYLDKGFGTLLKVGTYGSAGAADADGRMLLYGSDTSDRIRYEDIGKSVYAIDGHTLAVADAATAANRPFNNAVEIGRVHQVEAEGSASRATVLLKTYQEAITGGWYCPTGSPVMGYNPLEGYITQAAPGRKWLELFSPFPGLNSSRSTTQASVGTVDELVAVAMATNGLFELSGTAATIDDITAASTGGIAVQTDTSDGDQEILFPHQDTGASILNAGLSSSLSPYFGVQFKTDAATNRRIKIGLVKTAAHNVTTDDDQAFFSYGTDSSDAFGGSTSGNWQFAYSIAGTDTAPASTGIAVDTAVIRLEIKFNPARVATFWINGVKVGTSTAIGSAVALKPVVAIEAGSTNAPTLTVYAVWCGALTS